MAIRPRRTVRLRLTVLYAGLFLLSGLLLLAVTYVLVLQATRHGVTGGHAARPLPAPPAGTGPPPPGGRGDFVLLSDVARHQRRAVLRQLLVQSGIALALMTAVSVALGWVVAGRVLHRLRTVTATVRRISADDLHQRLDLPGPDDELKTLGDTFDALLTRLERAFEAQRRFVANASHELRTPLARQRTLGQLALSDPDATAADLRAAHERVLAAGAEQERLIEALLTLARGQTGLDARRPLDLAELAARVLADRAGEARQRGIGVSAELSAAPAAGNAGLAEQLVANLVDNGLRHNSPGGRLRVATGITAGRATVTVANTGPPVPADEIDRLFQPFQRLHDTRTARRAGLGLGLSIVEAVATAHDAALTAVPGPDGGLTVTVTFP